MELILKIELNSSPHSIIELQNGNYAIAADKNTLIINKTSLKIKEKLENHEKEINRVLETKSGKLITISSDKTMAVNELDENNHYKLLQRIKQPDKISSIIELSTEQILTCNCDNFIRLYKYKKENNKYELDYSYEVKELVTHAIEAKNGKVLLLTFDGDKSLLKLYSYDLNKKKIEKMLLIHSSICWNNYETVFNVSDKYIAINLFNLIAIIDKDNISIVQEFGFMKDFINAFGLYKNNNSIIYSTWGQKICIWECNEEGIWESKNENVGDLNAGEIKCFARDSEGKLLVGIENGLKIFKL